MNLHDAVKESPHSAAWRYERASGMRYPRWWIADSSGGLYKGLWENEFPEQFGGALYHTCDEQDYKDAEKYTDWEPLWKKH